MLWREGFKRFRWTAWAVWGLWQEQRSVSLARGKWRHQTVIQNALDSQQEPRRVLLKFRFKVVIHGVTVQLTGKENSGELSPLWGKINFYVEISTQMPSLGALVCFIEFAFDIFVKSLLSLYKLFLSILFQLRYLCPLSLEHCMQGWAFEALLVILSALNGYFSQVRLFGLLIILG